MLTKATVVGGGAMGTMMAQILAANRMHVALLVRDDQRAQELALLRENRRYLPGMRLSERIVATVDPGRALQHSEMIFAAIPCQHLRSAWSTIAGHIPGAAPICSVVKGIETQHLARPSEILRECCPRSPVAVLSGPSIAPEMARCLPTTVVIAGDDAAVTQTMQSALSTSWFRVYTSADVLGVELAGAVKNVIALAAGILDGLHAGDNAKAALLTRGLVEITRLGVALGARPETFVGLAGVGDLVTTCVSPLGRNRSAGERIGRGESVESVIAGSPSVIEGIPTTRAVMELAAQRSVEMPITTAVFHVLFNQKPPLTAITELMKRPPKAEDRV
ncbi:MAG: NAD(P)-dependent glycerol-3-phosphate dehydrogenase [Phycisphaerales bacterium]|nr:NAD(P)-dependent glycerol-3-phosphate dehydrogenase [Phycisphaerales bacterium]